MNFRIVRAKSLALSSLRPNGLPRKIRIPQILNRGIAYSIRVAKDAQKYKNDILQLIFTKRLCDVFDDEMNRIAMEVGSGKRPTETFF